MDVLARELAVSRATLYRTVRSRDALLADVLTGLGRRLVDLALAEVYPAGVDAEPLWAFASREPEAAHRVLLTTTGRVHALAVDVQRDLFLRIGGAAIDAAARGTPAPSPAASAPAPRATPGRPPGQGAADLPSRLEVPMLRVPPESGDPLADRAFLYVRVVESLVYGPMLTGRRPDFALAEPALRALLG